MGNIAVQIQNRIENILEPLFTNGGSFVEKEKSFK